MEIVSNDFKYFFKKLKFDKMGVTYRFFKDCEVCVNNSIINVSSRYWP